MKKLLLTPEEWNAFKMVCFPFMIDYAMYNDPNWGFNGSGANYVVYLKREMSLTEAFNIGLRCKS